MIQITNQNYKSQLNDPLLIKALCWLSFRIMYLLTSGSFTGTREHALMCTKCKKPVINVSNLLSENIENEWVLPNGRVRAYWSWVWFSVMPIRNTVQSISCSQKLKNLQLVGPLCPEAWGELPLVPPLGGFELEYCIDTNHVVNNLSDDRKCKVVPN